MKQAACCRHARVREETDALSSPLPTHAASPFPAIAPTVAVFALWISLFAAQRFSPPSPARKGTKKESGKRRKLGSYYAEKKVKDGKSQRNTIFGTADRGSPSFCLYKVLIDSKEKVAYSSSLTTVPSVQPKGTTYSSLRMYDAPSQGASPVSTETQRLLMENFNLLNQIGSNLELSKLEDNINLFYRTRMNITTVLNRLSVKPGIMNQMPPLPVLIDDNLFQSILPLARQVL